MAAFSQLEEGASPVWPLTGTVHRKTAYKFFSTIQCLSLVGLTVYLFTVINYRCEDNYMLSSMSSSGESMSLRVVLGFPEIGMMGEIFN